MKVDTRFSAGAAIVSVSGEVDMFTSPDLRHELQRLTEDAVPRIVVDLKEVNFMDSSGIATLVQALKEARPFGGKVVLAAPGETVMRVLRLANLTSLFSVHETVEGAIEG
jgi:anti-sigma B factor antagonist